MTSEGELPERPDELFPKSCCHIKCHILKCDAVKNILVLYMPLCKPALKLKSPPLFCYMPHY